MGTAESLRGEQVLTELRGIDGEVYALAQGALTVTGISVDAAGSVWRLESLHRSNPNGANLRGSSHLPFSSLVKSYLVRNLIQHSYCNN